MSGRKWVERVMAAAAVGTLLATAGCGAFFQCEGKASCGTASTTNTGDVVFAASQADSNIYAYSIATDGTLTNVSGSPTVLPSSLIPTSLALTPDNSLLYASTAAGVYKYAVSSAGVLSNVVQEPTALNAAISMAISPNGEYLLTLDALNGITTPYVRVYSIGAAGVLTLVGSALPIQTTTQGTNLGLAVTPAEIAISPKGDYIAVALGTAGYQIYPFDENAGAINTSGGYQSFYGSTGVSDQSVAFDNNDNLYVARTGSTSGTPPITTGVFIVNPATGKVVAPASAPPYYASGAAPRALLFADNYTYLYTANKGDATVTPYTVDSSALGDATLTAVGSAISGPTEVEALAVDKTGNFIFSAGISTTGMQVYSIASSGSLTAGKTATTATVSGYMPLLVATH